MEPTARGSLGVADAVGGGAANAEPFVVPVRSEACDSADAEVATADAGAAVGVIGAVVGGAGVCAGGAESADLSRCSGLATIDCSGDEDGS